MPDQDNSDAEYGAPRQKSTITIATDEANPKPNGANTQQVQYKWYSKPWLPQVKWDEVFAAVGVLVAFGVFWVYWNQLQVMSGQLQEMQGGSVQTNALIVNAAHQASELHAMAKAAKTSADAAKSAADTAKAALHISERAYVNIGYPILDAKDYSITNLPLSNTGHIPSGRADITLYLLIADVVAGTTDKLTPVCAVSASDGMDSVNPGSSLTGKDVPVLSVNTRNASKVKIDTGAQRIVIATHLRYNDGFPDDKPDGKDFCSESHESSLGVAFQPCDPKIMIPTIKSLGDRYPCQPAQ